MTAFQWQTRIGQSFDIIGRVEIALAAIALPALLLFLQDAVLPRELALRVFLFAAAAALVLVLAQGIGAAAVERINEHMRVESERVRAEVSKLEDTRAAAPKPGYRQAPGGGKQGKRARARALAEVARQQLAAKAG